MKLAALILYTSVWIAGAVMSVILGIWAFEAGEFAPQHNTQLQNRMFAVILFAMFSFIVSVFNASLAVSVSRDTWYFAVTLPLRKRRYRKDKKERLNAALNVSPHTHTTQL